LNDLNPNGSVEIDTEEVVYAIDPSSIELDEDELAGLAPLADLAGDALDIPELVKASGFHFVPEKTRALLSSQGIDLPTQIQEKAVAIAITGRDVLAQSHTGSGKTLAFGLSLGLRLGAAPAAKSGAPVGSPRWTGGRSVRGLVLTPTRELATQVTSVLETVLATMNLRVMAITGGASYSAQKRSLDRGADVVVGTPGRIVDLVTSGTLDLSTVEMFVLDEVDEMLDIGFSEALKEIRAKVGANAQALFFSATLNPKIRSLARTLLRDPAEVSAKREEGVDIGVIEHGYLEVHSGGEFKALINAMLFHNPEQALVFCKTRAECAELVDGLVQRGLNAAALHGDLSQEERNSTMAKFRDKRCQFLVATNVAARGIDVQNLPLVVNFSVPYELESYTHRTGRTGRAGAAGKAWTIVTPKTARGFEFLMRQLKIKPTLVPVPTHVEVAQRTLESLLETLKTEAVEGSKNSNNKTVSKAVSRAMADVSAEDKSVLLESLLRRHLEKLESFYMDTLVAQRRLVNLDLAPRPAFGGGERKFGQGGQGGDRGGDRRYGGGGGGGYSDRKFGGAGGAAPGGAKPWQKPRFDAGASKPRFDAGKPAPAWKKDVKPAFPRGDQPK